MIQRFSKLSPTVSVLISGLVIYLILGITGGVVFAKRDAPLRSAYAPVTFSETEIADYIAAAADFQQVSVSEAEENLRLENYRLQYNGDPGIPTLQALTAGAAADAEALDRVVAYYETQSDSLAIAFGETHPDRLKALFAMYVVHISHTYGPRSAPLTLIGYLAHDSSHCGMYSRFQAQILDRMGMTWRVFAHDMAGHAWIEVNIDGTWEIFDSTVNVWINTDGYHLIDGQPREWRMFYTPMNDITRPDARSHMFIDYNMPRLRLRMPQLGLTYNPEAPPSEIGVSAAASGQGSRYVTPWYRWTDTEAAEWETFLPARVISS